MNMYIHTHLLIIDSIYIDHKRLSVAITGISLYHKGRQLRLVAKMCRFFKWCNDGDGYSCNSLLSHISSLPHQRNV